MKPYHPLYLFGAILIILDIRFAFSGDVTGSARLGLVSNGLLGVIMLTCGSSFSRQHREIEQLKKLVERLRGPEIDLYSEVMRDLKAAPKDDRNHHAV